MKNKNNDINVFCQKVKTIRKENNLSKKEMAQIMGISVYALTIIEGGDLPDEVDVSVLLKIHEHFGVAPSSMFE